MKKLYILILFFICGLKSFAQGTDVIFWIDNSGSISNGEYSEIKISVESLIQKVLSCSPENRISIIQYSASRVTQQGTVITTPRIWIENDFSTSAPTFNRRNSIMGNSDYAYESLGLIGKALDHIADPNIYGISNLNRTPGNTLVIYFFTDAFRDGLVSLSSPGLGTNAAFQNYTDFKTNRNATFIVTLLPTGSGMPSYDLEAKKAAAAIASASCDAPYNNVIESYPNDPDGPGTTPRFLLYKTDFFLSQQEIDITSDQICSVQQVVCSEHIVLTSPSNDVYVPVQDNRQASISITASNVLNYETVSFYHAGKTVVMLPGFHAKYSSRYRAYIQDCEDEFICDLSVQNKNKTANYSVKKTESLKLYPNPTSDMTTISAEENIKNVTISTLQNQVIFSKEVPKQKTYEVNLSDYKKGIYIIIIQTENGNILTSKIIKE